MYALAGGQRKSWWGLCRGWAFVRFDLPARRTHGTRGPPYPFAWTGPGREEGGALKALASQTTGQVTNGSSLLIVIHLRCLVDD